MRNIFVVSVFLYAGVIIFIGDEEKQLKMAFGKKYEDYLARVDRLIPWKNLDGTTAVLTHRLEG